VPGFNTDYLNEDGQPQPNGKIDKSVSVVKRPPTTRSGKALRVTIRAMADSVEAKVPAAIEDVSVLPEISDALRLLGLPFGAAS